MAVKGRITALLDANEDGEVDIRDLHILIRHEWMFIAGAFILFGSIGNVMGWWSINSDAFWAAAGAAAMLEYIHDTVHLKRSGRRDDE